jgi:methyltransferase (TIGR00027 family)
MKEGEASRTAEYMAFFRALESTLAVRRRLFDDPLAFEFLPSRLQFAIRLAGVPLAGALVRAYIDRHWPGARTSAAARTRFIDDAAESSLRSGVAQAVILGAGFDARAYRIPGMTRAAVFEVDHPSTSARKRHDVETALGSLPYHVRFVSIDFDTEDLTGAMSSAGYDPSLRTLFIWEGVTNYLTEAAVDGTLRWCAKAGVGSTLVFTYVHRQVLDSPEAFEGTEELFATLRAAGERWTFGLEPSCLTRFLAERDLMLDKDVGASDYRAFYYGPSAIRMRGYEFYRIAVAHISKGIGRDNLSAADGPQRTPNHPVNRALDEPR